MTVFDQIYYANRQRALKNNKEKTEVKIQDKGMGESDLNEVKGVGKATLIKLFENSITTQAHLIEAGYEKIEELFSNPIIKKQFKAFFGIK